MRNSPYLIQPKNFYSRILDVINLLYLFHPWLQFIAFLTRKANKKFINDLPKLKQLDNEWCVWNAIEEHRLANEAKLAGMEAADKDFEEKTDAIH